MFHLTYRWLAAALGQLGRAEEAQVALRMAIELSPQSFEFYVSHQPPWCRPITTSTCWMGCERRDGRAEGGWLSTMSGNNASDPIGKAPDRRKLIAVVDADIVGYSRLIGLDDAGTLERLRTLRRNLIDPAIDEHGGRIVQTGGDSLLIVFDSIDGAVRCAVKMQGQVPSHDGDQPPDRAIRFRIGVNIGDAIADGTDLHGDAVNVAARLQAECPPGGICVLGPCATMCMVGSTSLSTSLGRSF